MSGLPGMQDIADVFERLAESSPIYASPSINPAEVMSVAKFFLRHDIKDNIEYLRLYDRNEDGPELPGKLFDLFYPKRTAHK